MPKKKQQIQLDLFGQVAENSSAGALKESSPNRIQHEKKYMLEIMSAAKKLGLSCLHVKNYCGNKFNVVCTKCGNKTLATCHKILNPEAKGHYDIIGIAWCVETKHKINKGKQVAKGSKLQKDISDEYKKNGIPHIIANESDHQTVLNFLYRIANNNSG